MHTIIDIRPKQPKKSTNLTAVENAQKVAWINRRKMNARKWSGEKITIDPPS